MEENNNNNNENKIVEQGKQMAKDAIKGKAKETGKRIIKVALPYIGWLFLILILIGVLNAIVYMIQSWFSSLFNPTDATSTEGDVQIQKVISIDDNGAYKVDTSFADEIIKQLEDGYVNTEELGLNGKELGNMIEKYIKAEFKTMLPKTGRSGNDFDGNVIIQRTRPSGSTVSLTYTTYDDFMRRLNSQDGSVLNYFSINPANFNLLIAEPGASSQTYYDYSEQKIKDMGSSSAITLAGDDEHGIDYISLIQNYGAPFNFFLSLHLIALDADFMNDLLKMILDDSKPIYLTFVDNETYTETRYDYTGKVSYYSKKTQYVRVNEMEEWRILGEFPAELWYSDVVDNSTMYLYQEAFPKMEINNYWKMESTSSSGRLYVTYADSWIKKMERTVTNSSPGGDPTKSEKKFDIMTSPDSNLTEKMLDLYYKETTWTYARLENFIETTTTTTTNKTNTVTDVENRIKVDEFIEFLKKYPNVVDNLKSAPSQLFHSLEEDEKTQKLAKVMRYVLLHLTGVDYGVTSIEDLEDLLTDQDFTEYSGVSNLIDYLHQFGGNAPKDGYYPMYWDGADWPTIGRDDLQWKSSWTRFDEPGWVKHKGEEKEVANVAEYIKQNCLTRGHTVKYSKQEIAAMDIQIEAELTEKAGENKILGSYWDPLVKKMEELNLSRQQLFALCAIYYNFGHIPTRDNKTFKDVYLEGINEKRFEKNSWQHNKYIWDEWWSKVGGGINGNTLGGHIKIRDAQFETYVKGIFDYSQSDAGTAYGRKYYMYYTQKQLDAFAPHMASGESIPYRPLHRTSENEEEIFTMVEAKGEITGTYADIAGYEFEIYTSKYTGKSYIWYYQNYGPWSSSLADAGCAMTSAAIIASGYGDMRRPQWGLGHGRFEKADSSSKSCGGNSAYGKNLTDAQIKEIQDWLFSGKEVIIHVGGGSVYTDTQHWMPLVDISDDGKMVYNMNTHTGYGESQKGWCSIESFRIDVDCYHLIDKLKPY